MPEASVVGLIVAAVVIVAVVVALLFARAPVRHRPPEGTPAALLALARGERQKARRLLVDAVDAGESSPEALLVLGLLLREQGEVRRALHLHHAVLARPALDPERRRLAELQIADDLLAGGHAGQARKRLGELDEHFLDGELLERLALAQLRDGDRGSAAETWARRAALDPDDEAARARSADAIGEIARDDLRAGEHHAAERHARRALEIDPGRVVGHLVLGDLALAQGRPDEALAAWREGLSAAPGGAALLLGRVLEIALQKGRMEGLVDVIADLRESRPEDPPLWRAAADLRLRRGDRESFFALLEDAPAGAARDIETWAGWIRHLHARGDAEELRRLLAAMPDAFGPSAWRCGECGAEESEPRLACGRCGVVRPLRALAQRGPTTGTRPDGGTTPLPDPGGVR